MTHNAKLIQISYKTNFWVLRCKKKVRFSFHFYFQLNFFFFVCLESWSTFDWETKYKPTWENKEHDPSAKTKFKLVIKSNVFEKVHDHHPTCFSKSNNCHHANHGSITTYQPSKWWRNIDLFPKGAYIYMTSSWFCKNADKLAPNFHVVISGATNCFFLYYPTL